MLSIAGWLRESNLVGDQAKEKYLDGSEGRVKAVLTVEGRYTVLLEVAVPTPQGVYWL